jgi:hypothetical protein
MTASIFANVAGRSNATVAKFAHPTVTNAG